MASLGARIKSAFQGFLLPGTGRPLVYSVPVHTFAPRRGSREILVAYRENGWLKAVVDTVARAVAAPRWHVYKPTSTAGKRLLGRCKSLSADARGGLDGMLERHKALAAGLTRGDLVRLEQHELLALLTNPHPRYTGRSYRELQQVHLDLVGESFLWLRRGVDMRPVGYEVLPPSSVVMTPWEAGEPLFRVNYNLFQDAIPASEVLWLKYLDPENPEARGAGLGLALGDELDTAESVQHTRKATFRRGGLPAAVIGVEGDDAEEQKLDLEKHYEERFNSPTDAGKVLFVSGTASFAQIQQDFRALQLDETEKGLRDYVRQCYGIPPELIGDLSSGTRATADEAKYTLAEYAVLPRLEWQREEYQHKLVPLVDSAALLDFEDPRPQDWERRLKAMTASYGPHVRKNEARSLAGLASDPRLEGQYFDPLPGAQPVQDEAKTPRNPPPPRGPGRD